MTTTAEPRRGAVEIRSIDYVPLAERHGKLWHLGPLWFMSNAQIATLAVGVLGVGAGGNLVWSLIAILLGVVVGTFFMAAHCSQGPQLGLPQMIQSRPQFGYVGAILVWLFAYLQYAGFNVFNTLLASESVTSVTGGGIGQVRLWLVVGTALAAAAAIYGYDLIHRMEQALTYGFLLLFGILTVIVLTLHYPAGSFYLSNFDLTPFLAPVLGRRGLPDQLGDLRLRLLALPAARGHDPQDLPLDLRRLGARRGLDHVHRLGTRRLGGHELQRHRHRRAARRRRQVLRRLRRRSS